LEREELLQLLKADVARFNEYRRQSTDPIDFSGIDLNGANLKGADLRRINFQGACFRGADLSEAEMTGAVLDGADPRGATLRGTNFHHASLRGADLRAARFTARTPRGRLCINLSSFEGAAWDRSHLEEILSILNQNRDWLIKYELVAKDSHQP